MEQKICMDLEICNLDYTVGHFITVTISWQSWEQHRNMTRMFSKFLTLIILISASNITYLLVSLFILYIGIILYIDGDYLYNKVKDFAISRCKYTCHNSLLHFSPHLKFTGPYKTILAKLPFPQLIAHNPCWSIHQTFKGRPTLDLSSCRLFNEFMTDDNLQFSVSNFRRNVVRRVHSETGLNYLTDTLTSAWDAMR